MKPRNNRRNAYFSAMLMGSHEPYEQISFLSVSVLRNNKIDTGFSTGCGYIIVGVSVRLKEKKRKKKPAKLCTGNGSCFHQKLLSCLP